MSLFGYAGDAEAQQACPVPLGDLEYCTECGLCVEGQGDCDSGQCEPGLVCIPNVGDQFGFGAEIDICLPPGSGICSVPLGDLEYCSLCGPCVEGEGDCDTTECVAGLECAADVGPQFGFGPDIDVCVSSVRDVCNLPLGDFEYCTACGPCLEGEGDCDSGQCDAGLVCVADVGTQLGFAAEVDVCLTSGREVCDLPLGDFEYCTTCGPCLEGEGDCDSGQCDTGLVCVGDVGPQFGFAAEIDVCLTSGQEVCDLPLGDFEYCSTCGPCQEGQGDCDAGECADGLTCIADNGPQFGFEALIDVCVVAEAGGCSLPLGDFAYCSTCGPCQEGQGDCDADECADGLTCLADNGPQFGFGDQIDVCVVSETGGCSLPRGDFDYCAVCGPCPQGEGDCDSDAECATGLTCRDDIGPQFGWDPMVDVCL